MLYDPMPYARGMKVIKTIVAVGPDAEVIEFVKPVTIKWYEGDSAMHVAHAVTQILADAEDSRFTRTLAISIEL